MAKTPKLKNKKPKSIHSRAARRAASPSDEVDKSLTSLPRAETAIPQPPSVLAAHANAGVSKKKAKSKPKTRAQRLRQQKGIERAEIVMDQLEKKVAKSAGKGKKIKERKVNWDEINRKQPKATKNDQEAMEGPDADDAMVDDDQPTTSTAPQKFLPESTNAPAASHNQVADEPEEDEEDEIT